jgi:hypothetical protein
MQLTNLKKFMEAKEVLIFFSHGRCWRHKISIRHDQCEYIMRDACLYTRKNAVIYIAKL